MAEPIWKDYIVNLGNYESVDYQIRCNSDVIYAGRAWRRPGESNVSIRINDVCESHQRSINAHTCSFSVYVYREQGGWIPLVMKVTFYNDWSYDYDFNPNNGLSFPINGRVDNRQTIVYSELESTSVAANLKTSNGTSSSVTLEFSNGVAKLDLSQQSDVTEVKIGNVNYKVVNGCNRYALYYLNAYGGWDSLLIEGNHSESDNLTRYTRDVEYDNTNVQNRGRINYVTEISKTLTLHTSWLSDDESSRMHHLLNSTSVYLYDMERAEGIPVILNNSTTEYKTYKSNGNKLVNYAIEVSYANDRVRK